MDKHRLRRCSIPHDCLVSARSSVVKSLEVALAYNLSGNSNVAIGAYALEFNTSGSNNTASGTADTDIIRIGTNQTSAENPLFLKARKKTTKAVNHIMRQDRLWTTFPT
jgi:hypothetical protein